MILGYLLEHPRAKDTIKGVCKWWLTQKGAEYETPEVPAILTELVAKGWLTARETPHSETIYGLNRERVIEITAFLRKLSRPGEKGTITLARIPRPEGQG